MHSNVLSLSADQILAILEPEQLFTSEANVRKEFKALAFTWHPDRNASPQATEVFAQITALHELALIHLKQGKWTIPGQMRLVDTAGVKYILRFRTRHRFELGEMLISDTVVIYILDKGNYDLFQNAGRQISNFKFANTKMETEMLKYLPVIKKTFRTQDGRDVMVVEKTPDMLLLRDVVNHFKGKLDPKHTAWVISRLYNLTCYLEYAGISNNDISLDTCFISPLNHGTALYGGWWYSSRHGSKLTAVPARTYGLIPKGVKDSKLSQIKVDLELVRAVGRELGAGVSGTPQPMVNWFKTASPGNAVTDYTLWRDKVLLDSFGKPKFNELKLTADHLYK